MDYQLSEREEYLAWQVAVICKLWIDGQINEAKILAESNRRLISRIIPNVTELERGLELITSGLVWKREAHSDLVWNESSGDGSFPWALISKFPDRFEVRLILFRCKNGIKCGSSVCECFNYNDCDRVEIYSTSPETWDDAWYELCRLYLSWFFSHRALTQGLRSRAEINKDYYNIRNKLNSEKLLTEIEPLTYDEKEQLAYRVAERHARYEKYVMELKSSILDFYENELPIHISKYREELISNCDTTEKDIFAESESLDWILWRSISNLDLAYNWFNRIKNRSIKKQIKSEIFDLIDKKFTEAIKYLATEETESNWVENGKFDLIELSLDPERLRMASSLFNKTIELILTNRIVLGEAEIPAETASYSPLLENILTNLIKSAVCIEDIVPKL